MRICATILLATSLCFVGCDEDDSGPSDPGDPFPESLQIVGGQNAVGPVAGRSTEPISVRTLSGGGDPVEGVNVIFAIQSGDASVEDEVVTTDASGVAFTYVNFGTTLGMVEATATAHGLSGSPALFHLMSLAADAERIVIVSGNGQSGTVGSSLADPLVVEVFDAFDNPVEGASVLFAVELGGGTTDPSPVQTDAEGRASSSWTLGTSAGPQRVRPVIEDQAGFPAVFQATANPDVATTLGVAAGDLQGGAAGAELTLPLTVEVMDQYENPVPGHTVDFTVTAGDGSLGQASAQSDAAGLAQVSFTLGSEGDHSVEASSDGTNTVSFSARSFPPTTLDAPTKSISTVSLSWSGAPGAGFVAYALRRSTSSPVQDDDALLGRITDAGTTSYEDDNVELGVRYYYRLFVEYAEGYRVVSDEQSIEAGVRIELDGIAADFILDASRDRVYVSVPTQNSISVISTTTFEIVENVFVGSTPLGIDMSPDGAYLFAALNGAGAVATMDLSTNSVDEILIGTELGDDRTYDVSSPMQDVLVVTANASSSGFSYVVRVDLDFVGGHAAARIANNRIIRASPAIVADPSGDFVYIGEGFSPNSLYKIDMLTVGNPIVLEDDHGSVSGTTQIDISPDGTRIYTRVGQILRTASFNQAGTIGAGVPLVNLDGSRCFMGGSGWIRTFNTTTFLQVAEATVPGTIDRMLLLEGGSGLLAIDDDLIYGIEVPQE